MPTHPRFLDAARNDKLDSARNDKRDFPRNEKRDSPRNEKRDSPRNDKRDSARKDGQGNQKTRKPRISSKSKRVGTPVSTLSLVARR